MSATDGVASAEANCPLEASWVRIPKSPSLIKQTMKVIELLSFIHNNQLSPDAEILVERVHDTYFEDHGWKVHIRKDFDGMSDSQYIEVWDASV